MIMYERVRKAIFGHRVECKGGDQLAVKAVVWDLDTMGLKKAVYRSDQEPAIRALMRAVNVAWHGELIPEESRQSRFGQQCGG